MYEVMIADDEPLMRESLKIMISQVEGFMVSYCVGNGKDAVDVCERNRVDVAFMDIMMPGESGIEASKEIYAQNKNTTIYIVSSYNVFDFAIEALESKVKAYISKPVRFNRINEILQRYKMENSKHIENELGGISKLIRQNDFKKAKESIPKIVKRLFSKITCGKTQKDIAVEFAQSLLDSVNFIKGEKKDITKLICIDDQFSREEKYFEFWFFKVINYIFQYNSVKKYPVLAEVFSFIDRHVYEEIGLNEIISNCPVSQGYLSRIFKKQFNISIMEYLHMMRINKAKSYFCFTNLTTTEIAFMLGYNDSGYFSKVFKKYENRTINKYKKMVLGGDEV